MKYSEHIEAVKYVRDSIEKEIRWLKNIFFSDILEDIVTCIWQIMYIRQLICY